MRYLTLLFLLATSCGGSVRNNARSVSNAVAQVANNAGSNLLVSYCSDSMRAIGRGSRYEGGHCFATGANADRAATAEELAALRQIREQWRPVLAAQSEVAHLHDSVRLLLEATDPAASENLLKAIGQLAEAYQSLRTSASVLGIALPELTGSH